MQAEHVVSVRTERIAPCESPCSCHQMTRTSNQDYSRLSATAESGASGRLRTTPVMVLPINIAIGMARHSAMPTYRRAVPNHQSLDDSDGIAGEYQDATATARSTQAYTTTTPMTMAAVIPEDFRRSADNLQPSDSSGS